MISRISAVIVCILSAVWLARAPDWEPLIATIVAFSSYIGIEIAQKQKRETKTDPPKVEQTPPEKKPVLEETKPGTHLQPIDKDSERVLTFLANKSSGAWSAHVGHELKMTIAEVEFCFDQLRDHKLIRQVRADTGSGAEYGVTPEGRKLLFQK